MKYKVCSFNIRTDCDVGDRSFEKRKPVIIDTVKQGDFDIIGWQEVMPHVKDWLIESFPEYTVVGNGRDPDYKNESNPVMFKKEKFELIGLETRWLSTEPFVPGTIYPGAGCRRVCTTVTLLPKTSTVPFRFYNTHLDHVSDDARALGMSVILDKMKEDDSKMVLKHILTGDFNSAPEGRAIRMVNEFADHKMKEATEVLKGTYHGYGTDSQKIDYIFIDEDMPFSSPEMWTVIENGIYTSDHWPVSAVVDIE